MGRLRGEEGVCWLEWGLIWCGCVFILFIVLMWCFGY